MTIDCNLFAVKLRPDALTALGFARNHCYETFAGLVHKQVLQQKGHYYRINPNPVEWLVDELPGLNKPAFRNLFTPTTIESKNRTSQSQIQTEQSQHWTHDKKESSKEKNINIYNNKNLGGTSYPRDNEGSPPPLLLLFKTEFEKTLGAPYNVIWKKDMHHLHELTNYYGEPKLRDLIPLFFQLYRDGEPFLRKSAMSIGVFASQINKLLVASRKEANQTESNLNQRENIHKASNTAYFQALR